MPQGNVFNLGAFSMKCYDCGIVLMISLLMMCFSSFKYWVNYLHRYKLGNDKFCFYCSFPMHRKAIVVQHFLRLPNEKSVCKCLGQLWVSDSSYSFCNCRFHSSLFHFNLAKILTSERKQYCSLICIYWLVRAVPCDRCKLQPIDQNAIY